MNNEESCEREITVEEECSRVRGKIESLKAEIVSIFNVEELVTGDNNLQGSNLPASRNANIKANLTLAFRHLEDARMRLGKAMQAYQGGISVFDRK